MQIIDFIFFLLISLELKQNFIANIGGVKINKGKIFVSKVYKL